MIGDDVQNRGGAGLDVVLPEFFRTPDQKSGSPVGVAEGQAEMAVVFSDHWTGVAHNGADFPPHLDREQCEYTLMLGADCLPEPPNAIPRPPILETEAARVAA